MGAKNSRFYNTHREHDKFSVEYDLAAATYIDVI